MKVFILFSFVKIKIRYGNRSPFRYDHTFSTLSTKIKKERSHLLKYEKVILNGKPLYREFCTATGYYTGVLSEEELIQQLIAQSIHSTTEIHEEKVDQALEKLDPDQKNIVETYINYLERVVESLERPQQITKEEVLTY